MQTRLRLIELDDRRVGVWLAATNEPPPPAEWSEACAKLGDSVRAAKGDVSIFRLFVVSDGGSPTSAQRKELFEDALRGHPVPTAVITRAMTTNPVRRAMAIAMNLLKPHYRVFEPHEVVLGLDHIGVSRTRFDVIWSTLRFLQASLRPVDTLRIIASDLNLPFEPLRPSQIPPSSPPPTK